MKVLKATYGDKDVTDIVKSKAQSNHLMIQASNSIFGDPQYGVPKTLSISVIEDGIVKDYSCKEESYICIPNLSKKKLGIFCSNNNNSKTKETIAQSLKSIKTASKDTVDIITCMWYEEPNNPFIDIRSRVTSNYGNLNHQLQILQCLYFATLNNPNLQYVSFLEHDVLYSEGHFDYDDFDEDYIINDNYIGLNKSGFQSQCQKHKPLSQITMHFNFSLKYFSHNIGLSLVYGHASVEPHWSPKYESSHKIVVNKNPNVHINHGHSFTSHYHSFCEDTYENDSYWGHYSQYSNLF